MAMFVLPLPTPLATGSGGGSSNAIFTSQSSIQLDGNGANGSISAKTNNKDAFFIDANQHMKVNGIYTSNYRLSINDSIGSCLELVYNKSNLRANFNINSSGDLLIGTYSDVINLQNNNVFINAHNGSTRGLYLGGVLVTATAEQINYTNTTVGYADSLKALITDNNRNISNINSLQATSLTGTIKTEYQPNISTVDVLNIRNHNDSTLGLSLGGSLVTASATELNYNKVIPGTALANRTLVLDNSKNITGINQLQAVSLYGTLNTSSQPNITSIGTLVNLKVTGKIGINTTNPYSALEINHSDGSCLRLSYNAPTGNASTYVDLTVNPSGSLYINPYGPEIIIAAGRKISFLGNGEITGLTTLNVTYLYGTIQTASQPKITSIGTLSTLNVSGLVGIGTTYPGKKLEINDTNGNCLRLTYNLDKYTDFAVNSNGDLYITPGGNTIYLPTNCTLRFSSNGSIIGISAISATTLSGTITTSSQPNITSIGTLGSLTLNGPITGVTTITATSIVGTITTASQPNITSIGNLTNLVVTGTLTGLTSLTSSEIYGTIKISAQPNITSIGTLGSLTLNGPITGVTTLTAASIIGTITTSDQPNITSIGNLTQLNVSGNVVVTGNVNASKLYGTIQTPSQPNITSIGTLNDLVVTNTISGATRITATSLSGTIITSSQPNITEIGYLSTLTVNGPITGVTTITASNISGTITTSYQPNITNVGLINNLRTSGNVGISTTNPTRKVEINDVDGNCLRLSYNSPTGLATIYSDIGVDSSGYLVLTPSGNGVILGLNKDLVLRGGKLLGVAEFSADYLSGQLLTASQTNITAIGTLSTLRVTDNIGINCTNPSRKLEIQDTTGKCIRLVYKDTHLNYCDIDIDNLGNLNIAPIGKNIYLSQDTNLIFNGGGLSGLTSFNSVSLGGVLTTSSQPNITSIGVLNDLTVFGLVGINTYSPSASLEVSDSTGNCLRLSYDVAQNGLNAKYVDLGVSASGDFKINPLGSSIIIGANKNIVFNGTSSISGLSSFSASTITATINTAAQPNITSIGVLTKLNTSGSIGINTSNANKDLEINNTTGGSIRMSYNAPIGYAMNYVDMNVDSSGNLSIFPSGGSVNFLSNTNLQLSGKITSTQLLIGNTSKNTMPLEVGTVPFNMTSAYAYNNSVNGHGTVSAGSTTTYNYSIRTDGRILCTGSVDVTSDIRLKKNIKSIDPEFCKKFILGTNPVTFNWKSGENHRLFGYVAQDLLKTGFGDFVNLAEEKGIEELIDEDNFISPKDVKFTVSYENIIPVLACNQKQLMEDNEKLKNENIYLRQELEELKSLIKSIIR